MTSSEDILATVTHLQKASRHSLWFVGLGLAGIVAALYFSAIELVRLRQEVNQTYKSLETAALQKAEVEAATAKAREDLRNTKSALAELEATLTVKKQASTGSDTQGLDAVIMKTQTIAKQVQTAETELREATVNVANSYSEDYTGRAGNLPFTMTLKWYQGGPVEGSYTYKDGREYALQGMNYATGRLRLTEFTGDMRTATVELTKSQTSDKVLWSGVMHNTDGRQFPFRIERPLTK
jgi:hypothetical protein